MKALHLNQWLHKEIKAPSEEAMVKWYLIGILIYFAVFVASVIYLIVVLFKQQPAHQSEIILPAAGIYFTRRKVNHFINHKLFRR